MTKKDYELIAKAINVTLQHDSTYKACNALKTLISYLIIDLQKDNPRFNGIKFMEACGLKI